MVRGQNQPIQQREQTLAFHSDDNPHISKYPNINQPK